MAIFVIIAAFIATIIPSVKLYFFPIEKNFKLLKQSLEISVFNILQKFMFHVHISEFSADSCCETKQDHRLSNINPRGQSGS